MRRRKIIGFIRKCCRLNYVLQKGNPWYLWNNLIWKKRVFIDVIKLRLGHTGIELALNPMTGVLTKGKKRCGHIDVWGRRPCVKCSDAPVRQEGHRLPATRKKPAKILPYCLQRESRALPTPWFWTSSLQNCERINSCCFNLPNVWYFLMASLGNECNKQGWK